MDKFLRCDHDNEEKTHFSTGSGEIMRRKIDIIANKRMHIIIVVINIIGHVPVVRCNFLLTY